MKKIAILGSTGSIGTQTLDVVREQGDLKVSAMSCGSNLDLFEKQIREFLPSLVSVQDEELAKELEEGMRLNTSVVKQLTSTDDIYGEKKFCKPASFTPSHTLVLYTNHLPRVGATDEGTWRRLIVIPFNAVFSGKSDQKNYGDFLYENAGPAVLAWIIEGAAGA